MARTPLTEDKILRDARMRLVIRLILSGWTISDIAKRTNCSAVSLYTLRTKEAFKSALMKFEQERFQESDGVLQAAHLAAARALRISVARLSRLARSKRPEVAFRAIDTLIRLTGTNQDRILAAKKGQASEAVDPTSPVTLNLTQLFANKPEALGAAKNFLSAVQSANGEYKAVPANDE